MKAILKPLLVGIALLGAALPAAAQNSNSTTSPISSTVIQAIQLTKVSDMDFGSIVPGTGGQVSVSHDPSARFFTGGVVKAGNQGNVEKPADFTVKGAPGFVYLIHNSSGGVNPAIGTMTSTTDPSKTISINFGPPFITLAGTTSVGNGVGARSQPDATAQLDLSGNGAFSQGAAITIAPNQATGIYTYTWTETVSYQ